MWYNNVTYNQLINNGFVYFQEVNIDMGSSLGAPAIFRDFQDNLRHTFGTLKFAFQSCKKLIVTNRNNDTGWAVIQKRADTASILIPSDFYSTRKSHCTDGGHERL